MVYHQNKLPTKFGVSQTRGQKSNKIKKSMIELCSRGLDRWYVVGEIIRFKYL